jgi:hypothetical protein
MDFAAGDPCPSGVTYDTTVVDLANLGPRERIEFAVPMLGDRLR